MKRILAVLVLALCLSPLVGCGGGSPTKPASTTTPTKPA